MITSPGCCHCKVAEMAAKASFNERTLE
jgi:hypothetical protein